jgi:sec-independent protein translocase protein TatA
MAPTWFKLVLVVFVIAVLFGRGRISDVMGDFASGIKNFKKGLQGGETPAGEIAAEPRLAIGAEPHNDAKAAG